MTKNRLERAEKLTVGLADEYVRWGESCKQLEIAIDKLTGDTFLSAAVISYLGPFTGSYRQNIQGNWVTRAKENKIPCSDEFSLNAEKLLAHSERRTAIIQCYGNSYTISQCVLMSDIQVRRSTKIQYRITRRDSKF